MNKLAFFAALSISLASRADAQDGSSCSKAIPLFSNVNYFADTTIASNWMTSFGPLVSPSNDLMYKFDVPVGFHNFGSIVPTSANYAFAMYLLPSCSDSGTEPVPIGATATIGNAIDLAIAGVSAGNTYYVAITGTAAGGSTANGSVSFSDGLLPVVLQSFDID